MIPCLSKTLFGIECLGCGFQRAVVLLFQGELKASFLMYPALFPLLIFIGSFIFNLIHTTKNYSRIVNALGIFAFTSMVIAYLFKHFSFFNSILF